MRITRGQLRQLIREEMVGGELSAGERFKMIKRLLHPIRGVGECQYFHKRDLNECQTMRGIADLLGKDSVSDIKVLSQEFMNNMDREALGGKLIKGSPHLLPAWQGGELKSLLKDIFISSKGQESVFLKIFSKLEAMPNFENDYWEELEVGTIGRSPAVIIWNKKEPGLTVRSEGNLYV